MATSRVGAGIQARNERIRQLAERLKRAEQALLEAPWRDGLRKEAAALKGEIGRERQQLAERAGQRRLF